MVMESPESFERYEQGLLRAASCCRELGKMLDAKEWREMSEQLLLMLKKGRRMYNGAPLTEPEVMGLVANMEMAQMIARQGGAQ